MYAFQLDLPRQTVILIARDKAEVQQIQRELDETEVRTKFYAGDASQLREANYYLTDKPVMFVSDLAEFKQYFHK